MSGSTIRRMQLHTAGLAVDVHSEVPRLHDSVLAATGGHGDPVQKFDGRADVSLFLEARRHRFDTSESELVTRGVWSGRADEVVLDEVAGSGFTQKWTVADDHLMVQTRWVPSPKARAAASLLPTRFRALQSQVLLHYPAMWWAANHGRVPLHVSVVEVDGVAVMLAGPGGVGKSTLVAHELGSGATATCDNLAVSLGDRAYGVYEPLRLVAPTGAGRRTTHGRRELAWMGRVPDLDPQLLVVVRRGSADGAGVSVIDPATAARALVGGTYAAGELQRFWPLCAMLAHATGRGPVHPPVAEVAGLLCSRLPCFELQIAGRAADSLATLLREPLLTLHRRGVPT